MKVVKTLLGQTLIDIAVQELGDAERVMEIAVINDASLSDQLTAGTLLLVGDADKNKRSLVKLFALIENTPASDDQDEILRGTGTGIPVIYSPIKLKNRVTVLLSQTLIDIAVQVLGDAERVMELAVLHDVSITDYLVPGSELTFPDADIDKRNLVQMYLDKALAPASDEFNEEALPKLEGIGYWYIEVDFIVQ